MLHTHSLFNRLDTRVIYYTTYHVIYRKYTAHDVRFDVIIQAGLRQITCPLGVIQNIFY